MYTKKFTGFLLALLCLIPFGPRASAQGKFIPALSS